MKKILIASDGFLPRWDGISSFLNEIIPRIQDEFKITVIAPDFGELKTKYKANIIRFKKINIRLGDNYYASAVNPFVMLREIKKCDAVWVQCLGPIGIWGIILARLQKKPVILYNHMLEWEVFPQSQGVSFLKVPINALTKLISVFMYRMCSVIMVPSLEHAELLNLMRIGASKKVIHLGVDTNRYSPPDSKISAKEAIGINKDSFVVGYAGRVSLEKDPRTLYRAFLRLQKKNKNAVLLIAGGGRPELEALFSGKENIILTGLKDNLAPYYKAMDVYVLSSLVETTSLTTMEAMSSGLPVVVTPVGFIKEYINDGINGLLFSKGSSYVLFQKLEYLLENPEAQKILGKKARETITENYTWDKTAEKIISVLAGI